MENSFENEIRELMASGKKIEAIKRYREETGTGLADAKAAVETLDEGGSLAMPDRADDSGFPVSPDLNDQIVGLLGRGQKIDAVKLYQGHAGCGLKEAKEAVERIGEQNGIRTSSGPGCLGVVLVGIVMAIVLLGWMTGSNNLYG